MIGLILLVLFVLGLIVNITVFSGRLVFKILTIKITYIVILLVIILQGLGYIDLMKLFQF